MSCPGSRSEPNLVDAGTVVRKFAEEGKAVSGECAAGCGADGGGEEKRAKTTAAHKWEVVIEDLADVSVRQQAQFAGRRGWHYERRGVERA